LLAGFLMASNLLASICRDHRVLITRQDYE
jgi:hypothetical protein